MDNIEQQRIYIVEVLQRTGWTQSELASRAGLDPSTLSRFLSAAVQGRALRQRTLDKIESVSGLTWDSAGDKVVPAPALPVESGMAEGEASPLKFDADSSLAGIVEILGRNRKNIDPWSLNCRALEGAGFRPGDILMVALGETPLSGDVVCAQIYDWFNGRAETVFRIFEPPYLLAASADPQFLRPFVVDDDRVQVKGVVIHTIRVRNSSR